MILILFMQTSTQLWTEEINNIPSELSTRNFVAVDYDTNSLCKVRSTVTLK